MSFVVAEPLAKARRCEPAVRKRLPVGVARFNMLRRAEEEWQADQGAGTLGRLRYAAARDSLWSGSRKHL